MPFRDDYLIVEETDSAVFITAVQLSLSKDMIPGNKGLVVRAYEVMLPDLVQLPGRNINITCHTLRAHAPRTILDTSGYPGESHLLKANDGVAPGEAGKDGNTGGPGQAAGNIEIFVDHLEGSLTLKACGGAGGQGQAAGSGAQGHLGPNGPNFNRNSGGGPGLAGGQGGAAGTGGHGGPGGDAGLISFHSLQPKPDVVIEALPGEGGVPGANGNPGTGGPGGRGGEQGFCYFEPPRREPV